MSTETTKATARRVANSTGVTYSDAFEQVREAITDLNIERLGYNRDLRAWTISTADANSLVNMLTERNND